MAVVGKMSGVDRATLMRLRQRLNKKVAQSMRRDDGSVVVGYACAYALYVHESPAKWKGKKIPRGAERKRHKKTGKFIKTKGYRGYYWDGNKGRAQPKFLEQPARELTNSGELQRVVVGAVKQGMGLVQALKKGGHRIQRESQKLVPVDTGNLKGSAFTAKG